MGFVLFFFLLLLFSVCVLFVYAWFSMCFSFFVGFLLVLFAGEVSRTMIEGEHPAKEELPYLPCLGSSFPNWGAPCFCRRGSFGRFVFLGHGVRSNFLYVVFSRGVLKRKQITRGVRLGSVFAEWKRLP